MELRINQQARQIVLNDFIEGHAFLLSRLLAQPLPTRSPVSKLDRRHIGRLRKRDNLLTEKRGRGVREEPKHTTARKPGPL
jgi:hypothetical protein